MSEKEQKEQVYIFADGACSGNPGPGGFGAILRCGDYEKELSGGDKATTNNRMELLGVITALEALKRPCKVLLQTDSQYIVNSINKGWLAGWVKKNFIMEKGQLRPNTDLWKRLLPLLEAHEVEIKWIKGHAGHPENERCDKLAVAQRDLFAGR